jgi:hypothetical protein
MLSDSILSFNTIHDRLKRCETASLRDGTWVGDELATQAGLDSLYGYFATCRQTDFPTPRLLAFCFDTDGMETSGS